MENTEWDLTAVYHDALDHFCHAFMKYNPPKMDGLDEEPFELFKDVVKGAYVYHDMMLDRLLNLIDDDTTVVICSDHGFHSDHLRPRYVPQVPSGPAVEHSPYGIFAAMGPGIKKGERIHGARILDVTPTLLTLFDLPVGRDMDGKPLMDIYDHPKEVKYVDSWEDDDRFGGEIVLDDVPDEATTEAALQQLIDLGYIDDLNIPEGENAEDKKKEKLRETMRENNFYLAQSYKSGGKHEEALEVLLEIENRDRPDYRYLLEIVNAAIKTKRFPLAEEYIKYIRVNDLMTSKFLDVLEAQIQIGLNEPGKALVLMESAVEDFPESPAVLIDLGKLLNTLRQTDKAKEIFKEVIRIDPENTFAYHGYGVAALRSEDYEEALEYFLKAIDCLYHYPMAHMHLGETLALMNEYELAKKSFEVVEAIAPSFPKTYRWLYDLCVITNDDEKAAHYKEIVESFHQGEKIILTGLPGEKLAKAIDDIEESELSIHGDSEDIFAENLNVLNPKWLDEIEADVTYVPLGILGSMPMRFTYRIVYVNDDLESAMNYLTEKSKLRDKSYNPEVLDSLEKQENVARIWIDQQPTIDIYYINDMEELKSDMLKSYMSL
jgi:tetratricopeptide (TPR) repeat protein